MSTCPECGISLDGKDPIKHAISHYGKLSPAGGNKVKAEGKVSPEGQVRLAELLSLAGTELVR